jgi:hypothetical protein
MPDNHFAQLVKNYSLDMETVIGASKMPVQGDPDPAYICTSFVEASNLHLRMQNRRYARRTNAHSKILENHCHMIALGFMAYNYVRKHGSIRCTPAQAASLTNKQWTMGDVITMADEWHEENLNAQFEQAFMDRVTPARTHPMSHTPTPKDELSAPWYLDENGTPPSDAQE